MQTIHRDGGSVLGSSRGGHDTSKICDAIEAAGVNMVFTIGGDGTMKGSQLLAQEFQRRGEKARVSRLSAGSALSVRRCQMVAHSFSYAQI